MTMKSSSKMSEIDNWVYQVLLAIECFQGKEELFNSLSCEKQPSYIRKWLNWINDNVIGSSQENEKRQQENLLDCLVRNLGFNNALSLLGRGLSTSTSFK